ncbi:MAG: hypothetical protein ACKVH8_21400 [Pirellulales bacterium]
MSFLKIVRHPYEEPHHIHLVVEASNGDVSSKSEYYCNATDLLTIAEGLESFPRDKSDVFLYELGSERKEDRWGYYYRLRAFLIDNFGSCALQLRINNNAELPDTQVSEFCIKAEASQINRLGQLFRTFSKLEHEVLEWNVSDGSLS